MISPATAFLLQLRRYAVAFLGPVSSAAAHFLLSLVALRLLDTGAFGHFSFLLIFSQFAIGIWSALFCAPLPILLAEKDGMLRERRIGTMFSASLVALLPLFLLFLLMAKASAFPLPAAFFFALFAALSLQRWFARAYSYAIGRPGDVLLSDLLYSAILIAGLGVAVLVRHHAEEIVTGMMALAAALAGLVFGRPYFRWQFAGHMRERVVEYPAIWKDHSGWSLVGVLTTEATINAQAYIVTLVAGPRPFALLVASALLTRPVTVVMGALGEYERAQMATRIGARDAAGLRHSVRFFRTVMILIWCATGVAMAGIFLFRPWLIFPEHYPLPALVTGAALWMAVMFVRAIRAPESAMMQGAGQFRPLARASCWSAVGSVVSVLVFLLWLGPLWSILGILVGELMFGASLWPAARRWWRQVMERPEAEERLRAAGGSGR